MEAADRAGQRDFRLGSLPSVRNGELGPTELRPASFDVNSLRDVETPPSSCSCGEQLDAYPA